MHIAPEMLTSASCLPIAHTLLTRLLLTETLLLRPQEISPPQAAATDTATGEQHFSERRVREAMPPIAAHAKNRKSSRVLMLAWHC